MSLRDAFTAIALGHRPTTHRVRSKLRPDVYYNEPACRDCEWTGTGSLMEAHAAHVADLLIAYLRDHLTEHAEELGLRREVQYVPVAESGGRWTPRSLEQAESALQEWPPGGTFADGEPYDGITHIETEVCFTTDWSRADD